jgi:hypothetical protein
MKLKSNLDRHENLENFGLDIESELTSMLSDELSKSIDAEILKRLFSDGKIQKIDKILQKINKLNDKG